MDRRREGGALTRPGLTTVLVVVAMCAAGPARAKVGKGERAPDFTLEDRAHKKVRLADLRGQVVVLDFWASWCVPCRKELPALDALARRYAAANRPVVVLAVNFDSSRAKAEKAADDLGVSALRVLFDAKQATVTTYSPGPPLPGSYVIDAEGVIRLEHDGYDEGEGVRPLADEVDRLLAR